MGARTFIFVASHLIVPEFEIESSGHEVVTQFGIPFGVTLNLTKGRTLHGIATDADLRTTAHGSTGSPRTVQWLVREKRAKKGEKGTGEKGTEVINPARKGDGGN